MACSPKRPCAECPWRKDVAVGRFPPERYISLAHTAYDMAMPIFACHKSAEGKEVVCAGYALQFPHNLALRLGRFDARQISNPFELYPNYRAMAVANGVAPDHPALRNCRDA